MRVFAPLLGALLLLDVSQTPSAELVRDRLDVYLRAYQPALSALVASERFDQRVSDTRDSRGRLVLVGARRRLDAEVAFVGLPGETGLIGFRRVTRVDGRPVDAPGESMTDLLQRVAPVDAAAQLLRQSAQHNLGQRRNTNLPSVPLELLQPDYRARFRHSVRGRERIDGVAVTVLEAAETRTPTIIRTDKGESSPSVVTAWVDDQGRLLRVELRLLGTTPMVRHFEPTLRVEFRPHAALGMLVPTQMRERFWSEAHRKGGSGDARYTDFRRFQTSARILPPPS